MAVCGGWVMVLCEFFGGWVAGLWLIRKTVPIKNSLQLRIRAMKMMMMKARITTSFESLRSGCSNCKPNIELNMKNFGLIMKIGTKSLEE